MSDLLKYNYAQRKKVQGKNIVLKISNSKNYHFELYSFVGRMIFFRLTIVKIKT